MYNVRKVQEDLIWVGASDHRLNLFENIHPIPRGVSYNSYVLLDEKNVLFDTVDWSVCGQFLENLKYVLDGKKLDVIIIHHVEPDHLASLEEIMLRYPEAKIYATAKAITMMEQFGFAVEGKTQAVKEGDTLELGKHTLTFVMAPMVHWPEVMVSYDSYGKTLFSADAFGTFGALDGKLFNDEVDFDRDWIDDARRYFTNIVGKYGVQTMNLLKKASQLDIEMICPLHGPVWRNNFSYIIEKHQLWATYTPEVKGVMIAYASVYGHTESAAQALASKLVQAGIKDVVVYDVSNTDPSYLVSEAFKYSHIVLASSTYNACVFPKMQDFLEHLKMLNFQNRTIAIMENGSWASMSGNLMRKMLETMKNMNVLESTVKINSSLHTEEPLDALTEAIKQSM
ncbi:FprA family A-type flavoprotein [Faecalicoccus pleomorphus]|uniref:FprA family A-type flavoprotein n=1 Tax=Faecalicoccus pleomorphus TaxID=1323 RepID=UPI0019602494|nr:FprA family A-type flavoprotein [Faecalicoccus pleomorphus]MBM6677784.1 FprA family A-type flavoprotein [Faecalicoccus pleomorphus]MBM6764956.1 FprA family A-type flavoprotein [Faecalicoccus pleomorphus]MDB7987296.1 FprA family A-type flavoprotein [Faecalicoccus pleomorphus]MDB7991304.1 FprA family A-type flavoprotein [Faecalicoccus pleomorphus]